MYYYLEMTGHFGPNEMIHFLDMKDMTSNISFYMAPYGNL